MKYRLTPRLNDGLSEASPVEVDVRDVNELLGWLGEELANDYGEPFAPGFTLLIERVT